jgi:branched-chain amino acid aminotransferase
LNDKGLIIGIYDEVKKPINLFSSYKTANSLIYILAGIFKNLNKYDDCLILNEKGHLIEAVSSNIFIVKNGVLYTPPITEACIDGIMRKQVINIAKKNEISFAEQPLFVDDLLKADEVFLTNSISGIQWAAAYKNKRYFKKISEFLLRKVNESVA